MIVSVDTTVINIFPSSSDYEQVLGLCGTLNKDTCDDFHYRDGSIVEGSDDVCTNKEGAGTFNEAWR